MSSLDPKLEGFIPVEGHEHKWRDPYSNAIVNTNADAYTKYMNAHKNRSQKDKSVHTLQNEVSALKSDISDMKAMLLQLVENKDAR